MSEERIILRDLSQADFALLTKELGEQGIEPVAADRRAGRFNEPFTVTVVLAVTIGAPIAIGLCAWLMKQRSSDVIEWEFEVDHGDGRTEKRKLHHKLSKESAANPELLKALAKVLPKLSQAAGDGGQEDGQNAG